MILIDLSSAFHKCTHGLAAKLLKQTEENFVDLKQFQKEHFITMLNVICSHIDMFSPFANEIVVCLDDNSGRGNWRKKIYPMYKAQRTKFRNSFTSFSFTDAYHNFDKFTDIMQKSNFFKVIDVDTCEADDIILVIAKHAADAGEKVLILSPDKDFIQLQTNPNVFQYSWMTNKMVECRDEESMNEWLMEHVCLGDSGDNVPRIVDFCKFKPGVKEFLEETGLPSDPYELSCTYYNVDDFESFGGIFENTRFGLSMLKKEIHNLGSLEAFLDTNPVYRKNYYRNRQLVLLEGIPAALREQIIEKYQSAKYMEPMSATTLVENLGIQNHRLPNLISNKYIAEQQLGSLLDW